MKYIFYSVLVIFTSQLSFSQDIFKSIESNNLKKVTKYLKKTEQINEKKCMEVEYIEKCVSPLSYASVKGKFEIVKLIINDSLKINNFKEELSVAFAISLAQNNNQISEYLFNLNPDLNELCNSCQGQNALMIAVVYGREDWYYRLKKQSSLTALNVYGRNLLHISVQAEVFSKSIFNDLLQLKVIDKSLIDNGKKTPLNYASIYGNEYAFFKLLDAKAEFYHNYNVYTSAWVDGCRSGNTVMFNYIEKNFSKGDVWNQTFIPFDESLHSYYPLEFSIMSNSVENTEKIYKRMLSEISNTKDEKLKKERIGIVYMILNSRLLYDGERFYSLMESIWNENKKMFEFLLVESQKLNELELDCIHINNEGAQTVEDVVNITVQKWEYKEAKKVFGKYYVDSLFQKLNIF